MDAAKARTAAVVFFALVGVFTAVRLWNIGTFCLDSDEVWSLTCARTTWTGLLGDAAFDVVHPPLFYMLLKIWVLIGGIGLTWVRLLPALLSFAALVPFYFLCRSTGLGLWQMNFALVLLTLNADQVFHSQYVRMYSLLVLLTLCSYCALINYLNSWGDRFDRRNLIVLGAVNVLLVYTHYYGWTVVLSQLLCVVFAQRKRLPQFGRMVALVFAAFVPWIIYAGHFAFARGGLKDNLGWIRRPKPLDLFNYYVNLVYPSASTLTSLGFFSLCAVLLYVGLRKLPRTWTTRDEWRMPLLMTGAFLPPLISFLISQAFPQSVWGNRHLVVAIVPFYILIALSLSFLPVWRFRTVGIVLVGAWLVVSMARVLHPRPRVNYEVLAEQMVAREPARERVPVFIPDRFLAFPMQFHLEQHAAGRWDVRTLGTMDAAAGRHFWVAYHRDRWKGDPPAASLLRRGYRVGPGVWVGDDWSRIVAFPVWR